MILIFSINYDFSTSDVINWLSYYKANFLRINEGKIDNENISLNIANYFININIKTNDNQNIPLKDVKSIWYRRTAQPIVPVINKKKLNRDLKNSINKHLYAELFGLRNSVYEIFKNKKWLNKPEKSDINKIESLIIAKKIGFRIPDTLITNKKIDFLKFYLNHNKKIIIKNISNTEQFLIDKTSYTTYTTLVTDTNIKNCPDNFFPSIFQELVIKEYDIRVFYLNHICYSMAIFSESINKQKFDFRGLNKIENRTVPYKLPKEIENKINLFMNKTKFNCASLDLIKSKSGFYFLEVNPVGQFGMVSYPCNYYLEKKIAEYLIK